ncbi:pilus assembly protein TadG-related protein [Neobacillus sp. PS3-12]|uniref:pilus assembly protein TadG-related protein n=1 Tax=Neobacillus sp. PS3-12 TaxID=3070677 RepID=UPI0027E0F13E|nr:pilus assembly protein TadG-related protein [Neobacillus sp. PS3-12]WML51539.1 pilus assembly protein TadG-related protein [Neobacillus sp. PS3-12]
MGLIKKKTVTLLRNEQGNIMVLFAFSMVLIFGMVGLVVDIGMVYKEKSDLKKVATTAVLSGAQELPNGDPARVQNVVNTILLSYQEQSSLQNMQIDMNQQVKVSLKKAVPLLFARIFGFDSITVQESATAKLYPIGGILGATPLGIDQSIAITYGQTMSLKVGAGDSTSGNFGILALSGPGARNYGDTLKYGFDQPVSVGKVVPTQTGNIAGPTQDGVNYRINQCPNPSGDMTVRNCARILPVIVYKPNISSNNTISSITVTGFAFFYLLNPMSSTDTTITGKFIQRVDIGTYGAASLDSGAYMARLVE